jgi:hypothetical protein
MDPRFVWDYWAFWGVIWTAVGISWTAVGISAVAFTNTIHEPMGTIQNRSS